MFHAPRNNFANGTTEPEIQACSQFIYYIKYALFDNIYKLAIHSNVM